MDRNPIHPQRELEGQDQVITRLAERGRTCNLNGSVPYPGRGTPRDLRGQGTLQTLTENSGLFSYALLQQSQKGGPDHVTKQRTTGADPPDDC